MLDKKRMLEFFYQLEGEYERIKKREKVLAKVLRRLKKTLGLQKRSR